MDSFSHAAKEPVVLAPTDRDFITALARGLDLLQVLGTSDSGLTLAQVAQRSGLSRATVRRFLLTLIALGYVTFDGRLYRLTPKVLALGSAYLGSTALPRVARPFLDDLSRQLHESSSIGILDGAEVVYVGRVQTGRIMSVDLGVGSRLPATATAMGRVLLAALTPEERRRRLPGELTAYTPRTLTDKLAFLALLDQIDQQGYCIVDQELELGLCSVAVPVRNALGTVVAALNIGAQAGRVALDVLERDYLPPLKAAARDLGVLLID